MQLTPLVNYLDSFLNVASIKDYPEAHNGLQLANDGQVTRIAVAVDACAAVIEKAVEQQASLLLVHHGLFWGGLRPLTGSYYQKIKCAINHNLAIYSAHLPLDLHPEVGNNALLARALGLLDLKPALKVQDQRIGYVGHCDPIARTLFLEKLSQILEGPVHLAPGGPDQIKNVVVVSGGAGNLVASVPPEEVDTFVTGEGTHWTYQEAEERGINLIYGGHYATETFGVKALGALLEKEFNLPWSFLDHPTGL
ncbi:MAG: Nif3-like dinuclear metal center hexameric protein [Chthoniobacterales bacterium]|nr:Nif3-like dinuclear metal center hexameric protein [Chthoniobacterales bacterium]